MQVNPKISMITPSKNTGKFAKETIESILAQTYKNWEHIVIDAVSTDETLDVLRQYPHIRWISEEDAGVDPFKKGLAMAKGEYIMHCAFSDGYLEKNWFKKCVEILDSQPEISLVWGIDQNMLEDGTLHTIICNSWFENPPPNGTDYIYYWLKTKQPFHERDFCVRRDVVEECYPRSGSKSGGFSTFAYNFNTLGYLPYLIPIVAAYGRQHRNAEGQKEAVRGEGEKYLRKYYHECGEYKEKIIKGEVEHRYRDGTGKLLPYEFNLKRYLDSEKENKLKKALSYFMPPIFPWFGNKLLARYRVYQNIRKLRRDLLKNNESA